MKIALFGATGRVGNVVLKKALADGYEVTVLVRSPKKLEPHNRVKVIQGDVRDEKAVERTIEGMDVVFSALGTDKTTTLTDSVSHIIRAMNKEEVRRIVTIGTAGILQSRIDTSKLRYEAGDSNRKLTFAAEEHRKVYEFLKESNLDWTIVCPTYLPDGEAEGLYRIERNFLPENGKRITVEDTASFAYGELILKKYINYRMGIAY
ncbi:NAD(P)-dependent oxidoreductase [Sporosarcina sp. CAU 1771]